MLNQNSLASVLGNKCPFEGADENWVMPHPSYNFGRIPATILNLFNPGSNSEGLPADCLGGETKAFDKVVVILIDAFGWNFIDQLKDEPFIQRFSQTGTLSALSTQFPSSTPVEVTTMMTGLPISRHGVMEFHYYDPAQDKVIAPFKSKFRHNMGWEYDPKVGQNALPPNSFLAKLGELGITSHVFQMQNECDTPYTQKATTGTNIHPFGGLIRGLQYLAQAVNAAQKGEYFYFYYPYLDKISHTHGPGITHALPEARQIIDQLETYFFNRLALQLGKTAILFFADHGQIGVNPYERIPLGELLSPLEEQMHTTAQNDMIIHTGSPRDIFVYPKRRFRRKLKTSLQKQLEDRAVVITGAQALAAGLFGHIRPRSRQFLKSIPPLIILPKRNRNIWWAPEVNGKLKFGMHGGLSSDEMVIPFGMSIPE